MPPPPPDSPELLGGGGPSQTWAMYTTCLEEAGFVGIPGDSAHPVLSPGGAGAQAGGPGEPPAPPPRPLQGLGGRDELCLGYGGRGSQSPDRRLPPPMPGAWARAGLLAQVPHLAEGRSGGRRCGCSSALALEHSWTWCSHCCAAHRPRTGNLPCPTRARRVVGAPRGFLPLPAWSWSLAQADGGGAFPLPSSLSSLPLPLPPRVLCWFPAAAWPFSLPVWVPGPEQAGWLLHPQLPLALVSLPPGKLSLVPFPMVTVRMPGLLLARVSPTWSAQMPPVLLLRDCQGGGGGQVNPPSSCWSPSGCLPNLGVSLTPAPDPVSHAPCPQSGR